MHEVFHLTTCSRRTFLQHTVFGTAGACSIATLSCSGGQKSLADRYREAATGLLQTIITAEAAAIRDASNLIARSLVSKNRWFLSAETNGPKPFLPNRYPGLPVMYFYLGSRQMAHTLRKGDTVLTVATGIIPAVGRNRGASVIGITTPSVADEYDPSLYKKPTMMSDLATVLIRSHLPAWDGLVQPGGIKAGMLPGSGIALQTILTALAGESYHRSGGLNRTDETSPRVAEAFFGRVGDRITASAQQSGLMAKTGELVTEGIRAGGRLYVYDPREILTRDITFGAGVPLMIASVTADSIRQGLLTENDTLVMGLTAPLSSGDYSVLSSAIEKTERVLLLHSPEVTGASDIVNRAVTFDNLSPEPDGVLSFDNGARRFLSTAGIMNTLLFWSLVAEVTENLVQEGETPAFLMNNHLAASDDYNQKARSLYKQRGW